MPNIPVENTVPYDESRVWALQDAYFDARGLDAWTEGDIPYGATSNAIIAKQHVAFLNRILPAEVPVVVLEIGSGNGAFAKYFLTALGGRGARGLARRLTYVMTDVWAENLKRIVEQPLFAHYVKTGTLVAATYDVREPERILDLDGKPLDLRPTVVIANYLACVTPTKILHKSPLGWLQRCARLSYESPEPIDADAAWLKLREEAGRKDGGQRLETSWRPCDPVEVLGPALGNACVDVLDGIAEGTVAVPFSFLGLIDHLVKQWGVHALITDFGRPDVEEMRGSSPHDPVMYGGCMSHAVDFPLFDHWGHHTQIDVLRTFDPLRMVHVVALRPMIDDQVLFVKSFKAVYGNRDSEAVFDLIASSREAYEAKDWTRAARLASQALTYDPLAVELYHRFGSALVSAGYPTYAVHALRKGRRIQGPDGPFDFDLALGRAYMEAGDFPRAKKSYTASLRREETPVILIDLARLHHRMGRAADMKKAIDRAEALAPGDAYVAAWTAFLEDGPPR